MADSVLVLTRLGGVATWRALRRGSSWREIRQALDTGGVVRVNRGRYALPLADEARVAGARLTGTVSHTSAAVHWGWAVARTPAEPHVTVSPRRHIAAARREGVRVHWRVLEPSEICDGWVTSPARTVIDCCLDLPFDEALAVVDSSWRAGLKP
ncbi:MAG TPA: hypothetical protein VFR40_03275, partial [Lapillicoccus sp.]|nr:hypothetical protein [Lapillicoccus sp.]